MNRNLYVRLTAFVSVVLLLIVSITPVLAYAPVDDLDAVTVTIDRIASIQGATSIFADGRAEGQFVIQEHPPEPGKPLLILLLTPQEGEMTCTDDGELRFVITGGYWEYQAVDSTEGGNDGLLGEFTMTITPSTRAVRPVVEATDILFTSTVTLGLEDRVIQFDNVRTRLAPSNPCPRSSL